MPDTDTDGFDDSKKDVDAAESADIASSGPRVVGELKVLLFDNETVKVSFPILGLWTLGRLEKAMSPIFRECIVQRQAFSRKADGLPEQFNIGERDAS